MPVDATFVPSDPPAPPDDLGPPPAPRDDSATFDLAALWRDLGGGD